MSPRTNLELVAAASAGDQSAWNAIVGRYLPLVCAVARRYRLTGTDLEDVSQTVWLRLVEHLGDIREPRALPMWISTTARNESLRLVKAQLRTTPVDPQDAPTLDGAAPTPDLAADLIAAERHQALREGLAELSAAHRELLLLLVADPPISYEEISARLDMPIGSIGPTRARCLAKLRRTAAVTTLVASDHSGEDRHELSPVG